MLFLPLIHENFCAVLNVNTRSEASVQPPKKLYISPPSANRIQLPDGRYLAYEEQGIPPERARFSLIAPHSFLSSRLAGICSSNLVLSP